MDLITGALKDKMAVGGISLESSLFPHALIGCPIPAHLTGLRRFSEILSAPLPPSFPLQRHRPFNDLGCFNTLTLIQQRQKLPFFPKAKSRVIKRL